MNNAYRHNYLFLIIKIAVMRAFIKDVRNVSYMQVIKYKEDFLFRTFKSHEPGPEKIVTNY